MIQNGYHTCLMPHNLSNISRIQQTSDINAAPPTTKWPRQRYLTPSPSPASQDTHVGGCLGLCSGRRRQPALSADPLLEHGVSDVRRAGVPRGPLLRRAADGDDGRGGGARLLPLHRLGPPLHVLSRRREAVSRGEGEGSGEINKRAA